MFVDCASVRKCRLEDARLRRAGSLRCLRAPMRISSRRRMSPGAVRLDRAGADEFSVVCQSLPRMESYAPRESRLQQQLQEAA